MVGARVFSESRFMLKMLKSTLVWQLTAGFAIGTVTMFAFQPANAAAPSAPTAIAAPR